MQRRVFLFHNHEPQKPQWIYKPSFRKPAWKSAFNWTMTYRFDSDIVDLYGYMAMRETVPVKNYTNILAKKTKFAAWLVSNCWTPGKRMDYVKRLQKLVPVDIYGGCGPHKCPRSHDNACFEKFSTQYKFYLSFESGLCQDYVSEKFFRYMETDAVVVARGDGHKSKRSVGRAAGQYPWPYHKFLVQPDIVIKGAVDYFRNGF
nr:hypothetical protein BaRGS_004343 [Batillaria attramentaria]